MAPFHTQQRHFFETAVLLVNTKVAWASNALVLLKMDFVKILVIPNIEEVIQELSPLIYSWYGALKSTDNNKKLNCP